MWQGKSTPGKGSVSPVPLEVRLCFLLSLGRGVELPVHLMLDASVTAGTIYSRWAARPLALRLAPGYAPPRQPLGTLLDGVHRRHCCSALASALQFMVAMG